jgi:hypothetical protein
LPIFVNVQKFGAINVKAPQLYGQPSNHLYSLLHTAHPGLCCHPARAAISPAPEAPPAHGACARRREWHPCAGGCTAVARCCCAGCCPCCPCNRRWRRRVALPMRPRGQPTRVALPMRPRILPIQTVRTRVCVYPRGAFSPVIFPGTEAHSLLDAARITAGSTDQSRLDERDVLEAVETAHAHMKQRQAELDRLLEGEATGASNEVREAEAALQEAAARFRAEQATYSKLSICIALAESTGIDERGLARWTRYKCSAITGRTPKFDL